MIRVNASRTSRVCVVLAVLTIVLVAGFSGYRIWLDRQPKFHDVTIELGSPLPSLESFLTKYASSSHAELLTDVSQIHLDKTGNQTLTFKYRNKQHIAMLKIQDTTPPEATVQEVTVDLDMVLNPRDFVNEIRDYSDVTVEFVHTPVIPESYGEENVQIRLTDAFGNTSIKQSKVFFCWIRSHFTLELGELLTKEHLLVNAEKDGHLVSQEDIDSINTSGVGTYVISSVSKDIKRDCIVSVRDTVAPMLKLKPISLYLGYTASMQHFVESATDVSGEVELKLVSKLDFGTAGIQKVIIEAVDVNGNITKGETTLTIKSDTTPPKFSNISDLTVEKNQPIDYVSGVLAYDSENGKVNFSYNAKNVNLSKPGIYYVTYTAKDKAGNTATYRRKITVKQDAEDTRQLVQSIAAGLANNPETIRDYVRKTIQYSSDWGGNDPVWYGFQTKKGNCYVHALCLQALLTEKGYNTQLIWVTDKTHYWLIIELDRKWYHIDATPGVLHSKYSLMTDEQRYETLMKDERYRDWDRSAWPKCG